MTKRNGSSKLALILLGSAAAVASIAALLYFNEDARERVEGVVNRERAKHFVRHNLAGSDTLIDAVDHLSDAEVNTIVKLAANTKSASKTAKDKTTDAFDTIVNRAKEVGSDVTDAVKDYFN